MNPLDPRDYDYLARKLGFPSMADLQAHRKAEEKAAFEAQQAELKRQEELARQAEIDAEDTMINAALASGRMMVELRRIP